MHAFRFKAVLWVLTGLATFLVIGRVLIRSILIKSFHLDDLFSFLAYVLLVITMILATIANPLTYEVSAIIVGESPMPETSKFDDMVIRGQAAEMERGRPDAFLDGPLLR
ncbi:hypothetical protein VM1G_11916 [Cytospora mali]|uniref:Uncharacterized protein n=1 Tax=Cytospora mali TaxID=578113 RepID=A0A194WB65_CYTMA|nr:hypothetical protein VM1G_11916 [Valsa mali]